MEISTDLGFVILCVSAELMNRTGACAKIGRKMQGYESQGCVLASLECLWFGSKMFSFYHSVMCPWALGRSELMRRIESPV